MKKITIVFTSILLLIITTFAGGCNLTKPKYESIALTTENYKSYLAINIEFSDYNLIALEESYNEDNFYYTASIVIHYTTSSKKPDLIFGDVKITYNIPLPPLWNTGKAHSPTATLDYSGNSKCSYVAILEHCLVNVLSPSAILYTKNILTSISGYVLVSNEG